MSNKHYMYIGAYIFFDEHEKLRYGAEYGMAESEQMFINSIEDDVMEGCPAATGFQANAWRMSEKGMGKIARIYMQRYIDQEYGQ